jgi:hypothetical protein
MMMEVRDSLNRGLINQSANGRPKFKDKFLFGTKHSSRVLEYKYKYKQILLYAYDIIFEGIKFQDSSILDEVVGTAHH